MGSLRNPIGPLPSSIYWRRRAVALSVIALLALLAFWAVDFAGSGGSGGKSGQAKGDGPAQTITPGPSSSGPAISERPGGREESGDGGSGSGGTGGSGGGEDGAGGEGGDADGDGKGDGDPASGEDGGSGGSGSGGAGVPAGSALADCSSDAVRLSVRSVKNSYAPGERPKFELVAKNSSGQACKVDFGPRAAVMTITSAAEDDPMWASDDCPKSGSTLLQVPAKGEASRTVEWDRRPSAPNCGKRSGGSAQAGTYLVEVQAKGMPTARVSFALAKD
ncbi:hypothetical protein AB0C51_23970 [Streptomyces pathocidini]|uniref:hypothetical protein n=1 Tax=Streptomyces pathocidini TaxID=1650571 RepID=UPI00340C0E8F